MKNKGTDKGEKRETCERVFFTCRQGTIFFDPIIEIADYEICYMLKLYFSIGLSFYLG